MTKVFLISGLGADTRLYNNIEIPDEYEVIPVDWIDPHQTDTLTTYAQKIIYQYDIRPNTIVIGTSLGGVIAIEIAKKIHLKKAILISSIKTIDERPGYFLVFKALPVYKLFPGEFLPAFALFIKPVFGKIAGNDAWLFQDMLRKSSPAFVKWAMGAILKWDNNIIPPNVYRIHGEHDRIFPVRNIKEASIIIGGSHIMIFDKSKQVNKWLKSILKK